MNTESKFFKWSSRTYNTILENQRKRRDRIYNRRFNRTNNPDKISRLNRWYERREKRDEKRRLTFLKVTISIARLF